MGLDWGLYSAMRGEDNWQQRRADAQMNLSIIEKQNAIEEQKTQKALQAEQGLNEYFNELQNMEFLEQDQGRVQEVEREARKNVIKGIAQTNGDLTRYMATGGLTDLNTYRQSVMKSDEVKQATLNKANLKNYLDAKQKGLYIHRVNVPIPEMDKNGEPIPGPEGQPMMTQKPMTFEENMALFKAGKVDKLYFEGAEKKYAVNPLIFAKQPKDPRNPFSDDNLVTTSNIVNYLTKQGASKAQAEDVARQYAETTKAGGDPWRWGNKSREEQELVNAKINKLRQSSSGGSGGKDTNIKNQRFPQLKTMKPGNQTPMDNKEREFWQKNLGFNYDSGTNTFRPTDQMFGYDADGKSKNKYDLKSAISVNMTDKFTKFLDENGEEQVGILANVAFDADTSGKGTVAAKGAMFGAGHDKVAGAGSSWEHVNARDINILPENGGKDIWYGQVFIPITDKINSPYIQDGYNKMRNITGKVEGYAPSTTNEDEATFMQSKIQKLAEQYGVSFEEAERQVNEQLQNM